MTVRQSRASFVGEILGIADAHDLGRGVARETSGRKGDRGHQGFQVVRHSADSSSQLTPRWREPDSNPRSHPTAPRVHTDRNDYADRIGR
jgi:hypothetical protein